MGPLLRALTFLLLVSAVSRAADLPEAPRRIARITLRPKTRVPLTADNQVQVKFLGGLGAALGLDETYPVHTGDQLQYVGPPSIVEGSSPESPLKRWIGQSRAAFMDDLSQEQLEDVVRRTFCPTAFPLGTLNGIQYANAGKPPLVLVGDFKTRLSRPRLLPASSLPTEVEVTARAVPHVEDPDRDWESLSVTVPCR